MVMHARKQPRLNDGFADRKDTHLHQYQSKSLGGMLGDRYERGGRDSHDDRSREDLSGSHQSPRYQNKSSYIERNKEKRGGSSSQWEKSNHQMSSTSGSSTSGGRGGHPHGYTGVGGGGSGSQNNHDRSGVKMLSKEQKDPKDRAEVQKSAVRVFGDWSEHISSSKKRYYYNCRTEVSQWEKPKEWIDSPRTPDNSRSKDGRNSNKPYTSSTSSRVNDGSKHSSVGERDRPEKYPRSNSDSSLKHTEKFSPTDRPKIVYSKDVSNTASIRTSNLLQRTMSTNENSSYKEGYSEHRKNNYPYSSVDPMRRRQRHESESSRSSIGHTTPQKNDDSNHADDMEISPGSTPTGSKGHKSASASCTTAALQTLQKLQEALNMHIARTQQNWAQNNHPQQHSSSPQQHHNQHQHSLHQKHHHGHHQHHQHPPQQQHQHQHQQVLHSSAATSTTSSHHHNHPNPENGGGGGGGHESPISDVSPCHSPAPSTTSSQNVPIATSALSGAPIKKDNSVELTPSLSNYYNEKLIGHVLGWQADHAERQANRYMEEAINVGSLHCSQVSVELKEARSRVRAAEIQSTLHEQRILFLDKQISEIDNLKPGTTFLPS